MTGWKEIADADGYPPEAAEEEFETGASFAVRIIETRIALERREAASGRLDADTLAYVTGVGDGLEAAREIWRGKGCIT